MKEQWRPYLLAGVGAGLCFAATAGTSTYVAFCFALIATLYGLDKLYDRRWLAVGALLLSGIVALVLSKAFLHEILTGPALATADSGRSHFFKLYVRDGPDARRILGFFSRRLHHEIIQGPWSYILAAPIVPVLVASEAGFFLVPFFVRISRDLKQLQQRLPLSGGQRALWACFIGASMPAIFLSSEPTQHVNDLGRHSGLIVRLVLIVWSTPIVHEFLQARRAGEPVIRRNPVMAALALVLLFIGIGTQIWQIVLDRTFLMIVQAHSMNPEPPFRADADLGARYFDLRKGLDTVETTLPPQAIIQGNPGSRYISIAELYSARQFSAGDSGCMAAFGGSPKVCAGLVDQLHKLYGGPNDSQDRPFAPLHTNISFDAESTTTVQAFREVCRDQHLSLLVAMDSDPAWSFPNSWVWQEPLYATPRVRLLACPATPDL